jgi:hypothetical protein
MTQGKSQGDRWQKHGRRRKEWSPKVIRNCPVCGEKRICPKCNPGGRRRSRPRKSTQS